MTKEDFFRQNFPEYCRGDTFLSPYWDLFEAGYELKQDILSQHIIELQADKGNLTDRVKELEAQIEKMKCCSMCKYYSISFLPYWCTKNNTVPHCTSKCDKWEIKEK